MTNHPNSSNSNGFTQKEMLIMILDGQEKINERIDSLHEKVNTKISRTELSGWVVAVASLSVVVQALM